MLKGDTSRAKANFFVCCFVFGWKENWRTSLRKAAKSYGEEKVNCFIRSKTFVETVKSFFMRIYYSSKFKREYERLPKKIKVLAEKKEFIFRNNPFESRLDTHKLSGRLKEYWAFSIDKKYRIIFEFAEKDMIWFHSVGDHSIYQ